jgi:hypothetical protein
MPHPTKPPPTTKSVERVMNEFNAFVTTKSSEGAGSINILQVMSEFIAYKFAQIEEQLDGTEENISGV